MKAKLEIELLENMHEYTISFNGIKRAISKRCYNTLKEMFELNQQCLLQPIASEKERLRKQLKAISEIVNKKHIIKNERGTPYTPKEYKIQAYEDIFNILYEEEENK